jgi:hypothetical protein
LCLLALRLVALGFHMRMREHAANRADTQFAPRRTAGRNRSRARSSEISARASKRTDSRTMNPTTNTGISPATPSAAPRTPTSNQSLLSNAPVVVRGGRRDYLYRTPRATLIYDAAIFDLLVRHGRGYSYEELRQTLSDEPYNLTTKAALGLEPAEGQLTVEDIRQDVPELLVRTGLPVGLRRDPEDGVWRLQVLHEDAVEAEVERLMSYGGGNRAAALGMQRVLDGERCSPPRSDTNAARLLAFLATQSKPIKAASTQCREATIESALGFSVQETRTAVSRARRAGHLVVATAAGYELVAAEVAQFSSAAREKVEGTIRSLLHREETQHRRIADLRANAGVWYGRARVFDACVDRTRLWELRRQEKVWAQRKRAQAARAAKADEAAALRRDIRRRLDALIASRPRHEVAYIAQLNETGDGLDVAIARLQEEEAAGQLGTSVPRNDYVARARDIREYSFFIRHGYLPRSWKRSGHWLPDRHFRDVDAPETRRQKRRERRAENRRRRDKRWSGSQASSASSADSARRRQTAKPTELPLPF